MNLMQSMSADSVASGDSSRTGRAPAAPAGEFIRKLHPKLYETSLEATRVQCGDRSFLLVPQSVIAQMADRVMNHRYPVVEVTADASRMDALLSEWIELFREYGGDVRSVCSCG